jgi:hypothetical protein
MQAVVASAGDAKLLDGLCADLLQPDRYEKIRSAHWARMIELRARRRMRLSPAATVLFENRETVLAQLHEQLRAGAVTGRSAIRREASELLPLLPRPGDLRATFLIDGGGRDEARRLGQRLASGCPTVVMHLGSRSIDGRSVDPAPDPECGVHYLAFQVGQGAAAMLRDLSAGATLALESGQPGARELLREETRLELAADLDLARGDRPTVHLAASLPAMAEAL